MKYKCICAYDGTNYHGFQCQDNAKTVQAEIERVLNIYLNDDIKILFCSRTDAGVHAYGQVFQFVTSKELDEGKFLYNINNLINKDIAIKSIEAVDDEYICRYNVKEKHYRYIINRDMRNIFLRNYSYMCPYKLDINLMKEVAGKYLGTHNFESFNTTPLTDKPDQVRTIYKIDIKEEGDLIVIDYYGDGFLKNMIRILTGMMIDVARGNKKIEVIDKMLNEPSKTYSRYNVTGCGLYLIEIKYNE